MSKPKPKSKRKAVLRTYDLNPDGVRIVVHWPNLEPGMSIFIPCLNTKEAIKQVKRIAEYYGMEVKIVPRADNGLWGIRVWREK